MFDRFSRSWELVKAAAAVLREDKELMLFPIVSSISTLLVLATFAIPMFGFGLLDGFTVGTRTGLHTGAMVVGFLFYVSQYFVIFFFNTALVGAATMRLDGGSPTFKDGINIAMSRVGNILGYALIAATVGMVLKALQERANFLGKIVVGLIGAGWTMATFLVVPVLATRDVGPWEAIKESATLLKKTWGENLIGQAGMGAAFMLIYFFAAIVSVGFIVLMAMTKMAAAIVLAVVAVIATFIVIALIQSTLAGIYSAALYRFATKGEGSTHFNATALQTAFAPK